MSRPRREAGATAALCVELGRVVRVGVLPVWIELPTSVLGVEFEACRARRIETTLDGVPVMMISRDDLIANSLPRGATGTATT